MCVYMYVRTYVCMYVRMYVCLYVRVYVCMYVCMYVLCTYYVCMYILCMYVRTMYVCTRVGPKVSCLTYKSRAKWKMLRSIYVYSAIYGEVKVSVSVCGEIKRDYIEK